MANYLYGMGGGIYTSAREGADGKPITDVQLAGRKVEEIIITCDIRNTALWIPFASTGASGALSPLGDSRALVSHLNDLRFVILNTHDQQATVGFRAYPMTYGPTTGELTGQEWNLGDITVAAGATKAVSTIDLPGLNKPISRLVFRVSFIVAPTTGSIKIVREGRPS